MKITNEFKTTTKNQVSIDYVEADDFICYCDRASFPATLLINNTDYSNFDSINFTIYSNRTITFDLWLRPSRQTISGLKPLVELSNLGELELVLQANVDTSVINLKTASLEVDLPSL